jgi:type IV pilus assembly protein PilO
MAAAAGQSTLAKLSMPARIGLGAGMFVLIAFAYWFVFYSETASKIEAARKQSSGLKQELANQEQAQASYFADRDELALRQQRAREFNKVLPADTQEAAFLSSIQQASNTSGIDLKAWRPGDEVPQSFYARVPMQLEMSGKFDQVAKFTYEVSKLDRIINIENIELADPKPVGDEVILRARCLATAFHILKPKTAPAASGQPGAPGQPSGQGGQPK